MQFVFELSLASAADKKFSAKKQSATFFWKYLGNCKKYFSRPMVPIPYDMKLEQTWHGLINCTDFHCF